MTDASKRIRLSDATQVLEALNAAIDLHAGAEERVELLLDRFRQLLGREGAGCALLLHTELDREPAPRVMRQYILPSPVAERPPRELHETQSIEDQTKPLQKMLLAHVLEHPRVPTTVICSTDVDEKWFDEFQTKELLNSGWIDLMMSVWAASPDRRIDLVVSRYHPHPPFQDTDRDLANLMLGGIGPLVDREIFRTCDTIDQFQLTPRQKDVLRLLLCGDSEKEIAQELHRSLHTIHGHVKQIYRTLQVQNRGELMALFVDRRILKALEPPSSDA